MCFRKAVVSQRLLDARLDQLSRLAQLHVLELGDDPLSSLQSCRTVFCCMDGLEHGRNLPALAARHQRQDIAVVVDGTALPARIREVFAQALDQTATGVRDDEFDTLQAAVLQVLEKGAPASFVFLRAFADTQDCPEAFLIDTNGDQHRDVSDFAGPGAFEDQAVEVNVGMTALDRLVAPSLNPLVDLLVESADRPS